MPEINQYPGQWQIPGIDDSVGGVLCVDESRGAIVLVLQMQLEQGAFRTSIVESGFCSHIYGTLFSGVKVVLYGCESIRRHSQNLFLLTEHMSVEYAFWGLGVTGDESLSFRGATFELDEAIEWAGLCHYDWKEDGTQYGQSLVWEYQEPLTLILGNGITFTSSPLQGSFTTRIYEREVKAEQHIIFRITYCDDVVWDRIANDIAWFRSFAELGTSTGLSVDSVHYLHDAVRYDVANLDQSTDDSLRPCAVVLGTRSSGRVKRTRLSLYSSFSLLEAVEHGALERWFKDKKLLKPIVDLYSLAYSSRIASTAMLFLSLMQALETLHARFYASKVNKFVARIDKIIQIAGEGKEAYDWLIDEGQRKASKIYLNSRIKDLLYAEGVVPVRVPCESILDFSTRLVNTRNYLTHYDARLEEKAYKDDELRGVNGRLLLLIEYHLLLFLGFPKEFAAERVGRKAWPMFGESWKEK